MKLASLAFRVGVPTIARVEAMRISLSTRWLEATPGDTYRALVLVGLASVRAKPWPLEELRQLAGERPGPCSRTAHVGLDHVAKRRLEALRRRLASTSAETLRALVLVGLDYAEALPAGDLGLKLARFAKQATATAPGGAG